MNLQNILFLLTLSCTFNHKLINADGDVAVPAGVAPQRPNSKPNTPQNENTNAQPAQHHPVINLQEPLESSMQQKTNKHEPIDANDSKNKPKVEVTVNATTINYKLPHAPDDLMQSGALLRGFYVLLGVTVILLLYIGFRMYRLRNGVKPTVMVRKYGVLANRTDVEMLPLPLDDEDEDDTVFEMNNQNHSDTH